LCHNFPDPNHAPVGQDLESEPEPAKPMSIRPGPDPQHCYEPQVIK
jgi:hypothetical protein